MPPRRVHLALIIVLLTAGTAVARVPADPGAACRDAIRIVERETALPQGLLLAIATVESGRSSPRDGTLTPWPWTVHATGNGRYFPTREEAIGHVQELQAAGTTVIDVGCLQVNLHHHPNAFPTLEAALDPLTNARYAARFLKRLQAELGDWQLAAGAYHSRNPERRDAYRARVMAAWREGPPPNPREQLATAWAQRQATAAASRQAAIASVRRQVAASGWFVPLPPPPAPRPRVEVAEAPERRRN